MIDKILIFAAFFALIFFAVWISSGKARKDEKLKQVEEANERNKDIARLQAANAALGIGAIKRMLRKKRQQPPSVPPSPTGGSN